MLFTLEGHCYLNSFVLFSFRLCCTINTLNARKLKFKHAEALSPLLLEHLTNRILIAFYFKQWLKIYSFRKGMVTNCSRMSSSV